MGLTNLLPFRKEPEPKPEAFFALELSEDVAKAAVWTVIKGEIKVLKTSEVIAMEGTGKEEVLRAIDMAIATANVETDLEPTKVVFGLPSTWTDETGIKPENRSLLKFLCTKLELKPLGYVVTSDALLIHLQQQQGTPPSLILIGFTTKNLYISLVHLGKNQALEVVGRSGDAIADVKEGLMRFKDNESLPSRILIYDGLSNLEEIKQQLLSYDWEQDLPFFHTPQIDALTSDTTIEAVALAGGREAAKALGLALLEGEESESEVSTVDEQTNDRVTETEITVTQPLSEEREETSPEVLVTEAAVEETPVQETAALPEGFVVGSETVVTSESQPETQMQSPIASTQTVEKEEDYALSPQLPAETLDSETNFSQTELEETETVEEVNFDGAEEKPLEKIKHTLSAIPSHFAAIFSRKKTGAEEQGDEQFTPNMLQEQEIVPENISLSEEESESNGLFANTKVKIGLILGLIILLLGGGGVAGFWYYWNVPQAQVTLYIQPNTVDKEVSVRVSSSISSPDIDQLIVPGQVQEVTVKSSETIPTTGTKRTGEKAGGAVTIYNMTSKSKTFSAGTVLLGPGNLRYTLSESIAVASESSQVTDTTTMTKTVTPGKGDGKLTASDIGAEYNADDGASFSLKEFPKDQFIAKASGAITGGKSADHKAVAKGDLEAVRKTLTDTLEKQAKDQLLGLVGSDAVIVDKQTKTELTDETFNHKVGEEADSLALEAEMKLTTLVAARKDFDVILLKALTTNVPETFVVSPSGLSFNLTDAVVSDTETAVTVLAHAKLMPKVNFADVKASIMGKYPQIAETYFQALPNYLHSNIVISPALPGKLGTLPHKTDHISITVLEAQ